jgi:two-component system, chemotaxis family, response regulator Rcp1
VLRIVLVEDNPADAQMLRTALEQTGISIEIVTLADGAEAMEYFSDANADDVLAKCDLVLLDLNLPRVTGFELLQHIKTNTEFKRIPVIVLSGSTDSSEIERCYQLGANSYICKATHLDKILDTAMQFVTYWYTCVQLPSRQRAASKSGVDQFEQSTPHTQTQLQTEVAGGHRRRRSVE